MLEADFCGGHHGDASLRWVCVWRGLGVASDRSAGEAGGNGGMINIVTRNRKDIGLDGNVGVSYTQRSYAGISSNASVNYRSAKSFLSFKIRQSKSKGSVNEA